MTTDRVTIAQIEAASRRADREPPAPNRRWWRGRGNWPPGLLSPVEFARYAGPLPDNHRGTFCEAAGNRANAR